MNTEPTILSILKQTPRSCRVYTRAWIDMVNQERPYVEGSCESMSLYIKKMKKMAEEQCSPTDRICWLNEGKMTTDAIMGWNGSPFLSLTEHFKKDSKLYALYEVELQY
jgi:hypothetical protein